jgi:hypothetical protein
MSDAKATEKDAAALLAEKPVETREQRKARIARVLERGIVADRLKVELPNELHGEWVANDANEVARMEAMGFTVDKEYASKRALHSNNGESRIGDVIHMIAPKEVKEVIDELRRERFIEMNGNPNRDKRAGQFEEKEFQRGSALSTINESEESSVNAEQIKGALFTN